MQEEHKKPTQVSVKTYAQFRAELLDWYRKEIPNSGLPSDIVIGVLYDDYVKDEKEAKQI